MKIVMPCDSFMSLQNVAVETIMSVSIVLLVAIGFPLRVAAQEPATATSSTEFTLSDTKEPAAMPVSLDVASLNSETANEGFSAGAPSASIFTVAGTGNLGFNGDGVLATRAHLWFAAAVAVDVKGNVFVADSFNNRIRRVDARTGMITTVAGMGYQGFSGDGGQAQ